MLVRSVIITYETIRQWCAKFGPVYATGLTRRQLAPRRGVLDAQRPSSQPVAGRRPGRQHPRHPVQPREDAKAAKRFFRKLLTKQCRVPRVLVTDKLRSYQVAHRAVMPAVEHRQSRYLNNRTENSHQPTPAT